MRNMSQPFAAGEAGKTLFDQKKSTKLREGMGYPGGSAVNLVPTKKNRRLIIREVVALRIFRISTPTLT